MIILEKQVDIQLAEERKGGRVHGYEITLDRDKDRDRERGKEGEKESGRKRESGRRKEGITASMAVTIRVMQDV